MKGITTGQIFKHPDYDVGRFTGVARRLPFRSGCPTFVRECPIMSASLPTQLRDLALLWCRLTGRSPEDFNSEFFSQLDALNRFTGQFPDESPAALATGLSMRVMGSLRGKFPEAEIRRAWIQLSREAGGTGIGAQAGFPE
ncbi:MAG: hypothetical protein JWM59_4100 [Verrucomicrobiales bacterium]|nr:hypothetical protein [Verrucomicrobiales bacterium]